MKAPASMVRGKPRTREEWLSMAAAALSATLFKDAGIEVPNVRVSVGWPGGRGKKGNVIGQCWSPHTVKDGVPAVFISPVLMPEEPQRILGVLVHELVHAAGNFHHRGPFARAAGAVGLTKPWTATGESEPLNEMLKALAEKLGPFPHAVITPGGGLIGGPEKPPVQSTRMLKVWCDPELGGCGYTLRATAKWLQVGVPLCPNEECKLVGEEMYLVLPKPDGEPADPGEGENE